MPAPLIHTFRDVVQHLLAYLGGVHADEHQFHASSAARGAYTELAHRFKWTDLKREGQLLTVASEDDGTLAYDHTGGASERLCTLSGGTVPTNAAMMFVRIGSASYPIERRLSATTFTLPSDNNPGADVAAGTSYVIYRNGFTLPSDFRSMSGPIRNSSGGQLGSVSSGEMLRLMTEDFQTGEPTCFCVQGDESTVGSRKVMVWPIPASEYHYRYHWFSSGRRLSITGLADSHSVGTVTVSGTSVTGTSTAFTQSMVGSVLRVSDSGTQLPSHVDDAVNPYTEERVIVEVSSATALTIDAAFDSAYSGVKYVVSDFIDFPDGPLYDAYLALAEYRVSVLRRDPKQQQAALVEAERRIRLARESNESIDEVFVSGEDSWPNSDVPYHRVRFAEE